MDPAERFIEAATAPLAETNAELHLAAQHELRDRIDSSATDALEAAAQRLEKTAHHRWIQALLILVALVSLPILVLIGMRHQEIRVTYDFLKQSHALPDGVPRESRSLTTEQKLLFYGDLTRSDKAGRWKALWDSNPAYPPFFANYVSHFLNEHGTPPPDLLTTAKVIDPDNGWYWAIAAAHEGKGAVTMDKQSSKDKEARIAPTWTMNDSTKHQSSLKLLEKAVSKPHFTNYGGVLLKQRIPLLPERTDLMNQFPSIVWLADQTAFGIHFITSFEIIAAEAQRCGTVRDAKAFDELKKTYRLMANKTVQESDFLVDALVAKVCIARAAQNFRDTSGLLGLSDDADAYRVVDESTNKSMKEKTAQAERAEGLQQLVESKGSVLESMSLPMLSRQSEKPVPIREDQLTPARRAEHAIFGQVSSLMIWVLFGTVLGLLSLFRHNSLIHFLARRLRDLLQPVDWAWIIGGGLVGPMVWHVILAQLSPLAAHHWSLNINEFMVSGGQFITTALLMIVTPFVITRWRVELRTAFLGFETPSPGLGWIAVASIAISIPIFGAIPHDRELGEILLNAPLVLLAFAGLWLLAVTIRSIFVKSHRVLASRVIAMALVPTYLCGMIATILCVPVFHTVEKHWVSFDHLGELTTEEPSLGRYEYRVTEQIKAELLETLKCLP